MPSYVIDAASGHVPIYGIDPVVMKLGSADPPWGVQVQDIGNIEFTGERVTAKDGDGKDVARIYFNRDYLSLTLNCYPIGLDEDAAALVESALKQGAIIEITSAPKHPTLVKFWRVTSCQNVASNTDKKMIALGLEESINQEWPAP